MPVCLLGKNARSASQQVLENQAVISAG